MSDNSEAFRQHQSNFNFVCGVRVRGELNPKDFPDSRQQFFPNWAVSKLVGLCLTLCFASCQSGPSLAEQVAAAREARNQQFYRTLATIKRLPPEQREKAYQDLQAELDKQQAQQTQQDLVNAVQDLADATRGY